MAYLVGLFIISSIWLLNNGANRGDNYMILFFVSFFIAISNKKQSIYFTVIGIGVLISLNLIYYYPFSFNHPALNNDQYFYLLMFLNTSICFILITYYLKKAYTKERELNIRQKKQISEAHNQLTNTFINIAHETRTPLTLIENYLDKYIQFRGEDEQLSIIRKNFNKLKNDMENFLETEKLLKGKTLYNHNQTVNFSESLNLISILFSEYAAKKGIHIDFNIQDNLFIKSDPQALSRVINNLIENAIKYSYEKGGINVLLYRQDSKIIFKVEDEGPGLTNEQKERIFEPYFQISNQKKNIQGVGMGLTIVNEIIKQLNGSIHINSIPDKGCEFITTFNEYIPDKEESSVYVEPKSINNNLSYKIKTPYKRLIKDNYTILIVEDHIDLLNFLYDELNAKYNVILAENGIEALIKLENKILPDIIISDIMMDEMNGYELHEKLKENIKYSAIPLIFITAKNSEDEKLKGLTDGAIDFIHKPFNVNELKAKIYSILTISRKQKRTTLLSAMEALEKEVNNEGLKENIKPDYFKKNCSKFNITNREKEILIFVEQGLKYSDISEKLFISRNTVNRHIQNLFQKVKVNDKVNLIKKMFNQY